MNRRALLAAVLAAPVAAVNAQDVPRDVRRHAQAERTVADVLTEWQAGTATARDVAATISALAVAASADAFWTN